jgi:hypothetical protein
MLGNSSVDAQLAASQERLISIELKDVFTLTKRCRRSMEHVRWALQTILTFKSSDKAQLYGVPQLRMNDVIWEGRVKWSLSVSIVTVGISRSVTTRKTTQSRLNSTTQRSHIQTHNKRTIHTRNVRLKQSTALQRKQ